MDRTGGVPLPVRSHQLSAIDQREPVAQSVEHLPFDDLGAAQPAAKSKGGALSRLVDLWIADGQASGWSGRTVSARRDMLAKFSWWLTQEGISLKLDAISAESIRFFLAYLRGG